MSSFGRCTQCQGVHYDQVNPRNLVVCIDGTSNKFGQNDTNVVKLFDKIDQERTQPKQYAYYSSGIGTNPKSLNIFSRMGETFDMAIAWNVEEIVKDAYAWLARMYQEGDRIYLFGFSRGAYQVRVLAGMIHEVGLVKTPTEKHIITAYSYYDAIRLGRPEKKQNASAFKNTFSWRDLRVHFIGVWDTVSSVGLIRKDSFLWMSSSATNACQVRHALALDERRVKFMPEYFREMNSRTDERKSKYIVTPSAENERGYGAGLLPREQSKDIKEVWFAGTHGDVGGMNMLGQSHQAGNASLLWMRREVAASGLVLLPTDIVWVPDDLDLGTTDPMTLAWRAIEYVPIKHQVAFSGDGEDARRPHRMQPRRIIPGQKVHASVLYANAYLPQATLGEGFIVPATNSNGLEGSELDNRLWETNLFDVTAAQELVGYLDNQQGVTPVYLDRLLFMLRFKEGRQCVRNIPEWQNRFESLIHNRDCSPLVRLLTIVAYFEASRDPETHSETHEQYHTELPQDIFNDVKKSLREILAAYKHRDGPRVIALLRPLTKHKILRERILTPDVLETFARLIDVIIRKPGGNFGQAMDSLNCLLQCGDTRQTVIVKLGENPLFSKLSRLSWILKVDDPGLLTAALRMVLTLARIPEARAVCAQVKSRISDLTCKNDGLVGLHAVEVLLALYDPNDSTRLNIRDARVRANFARALVRLTPEISDSQDGGVDPSQYILRRLFGLDAIELSSPQERLIQGLQRTMRAGYVQERTAATMTLLKLCETKIIRTYLRAIGFLDVLVSQLQYRECALLAAYALATCLKYDDMKESIKDNEVFLMNIVGMLRLNYFDDSVGHVEGFQIFGDFMQHADLRRRIKDYNITEVLSAKLAKGKLNEIRTSLIALDIFRAFDVDGPWTRDLIAKALRHLSVPEWKAQKVGVTILSALAQTEHGVAAIEPRICEIVGMLLPDGYLSTRPFLADSEETVAFIPPGWLARPSSWMFGPLYTLRNLAKNPALRRRIRESIQYGSLKHLHLTGALIDGPDTRVWHVRTPNRTDVINAIDKLIKAVDGELVEGYFLTSGDAVPPHIQHWNRLVAPLRNGMVAAVTILPALLGVSLGAIVTALFAPVYLSLRAYEFFSQVASRREDQRILNKLRSPTFPEDEDVVRKGGSDRGSGL